MNKIIIIHNFQLLYFILVIQIFINRYLLSNLKYIDFINIINYKAGNIICNINNNILLYI